jgi:hypothetical protein
VRRTVPPSPEIEAQIDQLLAVGVGEDEFDAWPAGRAATPQPCQPGPPALRCGRNLDMAY